MKNGFNKFKKSKKFNRFFYSFCMVSAMLLGIVLVNSYTNEPKDIIQAETWIASGNYNTVYTGGGTTQSNPYIIKTPEQLAGLAYEVNNGNAYSGKYFVLGANINLGDFEWTAIGTEINPFKGNFNGKGYAIVNLKINQTINMSGSQNDSSSYGLFGSIQNANINNIFVNGSIKINYTLLKTSTSGTYLSVAGVVARSTNSTITNVSNSVNIDSTVKQDRLRFNTTLHIGGVVGYSIGTNVSTSYNSATIKLSDADATSGPAIGYTGGVVGYFSGSSTKTISNIYNNGEVTGSFTAGGVVGYLENTQLTYAYNYSTVNNGSHILPHSTGGIVGESHSSILSTLVNNGQVNGGEYTGGIVAYNYDSSVYNATNQAPVKSFEYDSPTGGIIGYYSAGAGKNGMQNLLNTGQINSSKDENSRNNVGGIIGSVNLTAGGHTLNIYAVGNKGNVYGNEKVGGLVGSVEVNPDSGGYFVLTNSYNDGNVYAKGDYSGGIAGAIEGHLVGKDRQAGAYVIGHVYNTGYISGQNYRGGLIGLANGKSATKKWDWSWYLQSVSDSINGTFYLQSLTPWITTNAGSVVEYSYSSGLVQKKNSYKEYVGALIGRNYNNNGKINTLYFLAKNSDPAKAFGTSGKSGTNSSNGTATAISSFTGGLTEGISAKFRRGSISYNSGSIEKSTGYFYVLKDSIYDTTAIQKSFDESKVWAVNSGINDGKPHLKDFYWNSVPPTSGGGGGGGGGVIPPIKEIEDNIN